MRIVDLRPPAVRVLTAFWSADAAQRPSPLAKLATRVADAWIGRRARNRLVPPRRPFIVSIGNLALGGTGKTPVTAQLALDLAAGGLRGAVLTRGFGSPLAGPLLVEPGTAEAGDEARLLAAVLSPAGWMIVQARRRTDGMAFLRGNGPHLDVVLLEDGHQTAGVGRHLDVVILDSWTVEVSNGAEFVRPQTGAVAPFGPWRESALGARRAGIWLIEGQVGSSAMRTPGGAVVAGFTRRCSLVQARADCRGPTVLLSGIARPAGFERAAMAHLNDTPVLAIRCADHVAYGRRQMARLDALLDDVGAGQVITTAKDHVKLAPVWGDRAALTVLEMQVDWEKGRALPDLVRERLNTVRQDPGN